MTFSDVGPVWMHGMVEWEWRRTGGYAAAVFAAALVVHGAVLLTLDTQACCLVADSASYIDYWADEAAGYSVRTPG
jgi:hypothetical protein